MAFKGTMTANSGDSSYRVERRDGCTLMFGDIPISEFAALCERGGADKEVIATDLARLAGATFAFGPKENVVALQAKLAVHALRKVQAEHPGLNADAQAWLANGEHGLSSATMFWRFTDIRPPCIADDPEPAHLPRDPDDLRRCRLLLEKVPIFQVLTDELRALSEPWCALIDQWQELCDGMDAECPDWRTGCGRAEKTFRALRTLRGDRAAASVEQDA